MSHDHAVNELKVKAKRLLKAVHAGDAAAIRFIEARKYRADEVSLGVCQHVVSQCIGCRDWQSARQLLMGEQVRSNGEAERSGTLWHSRRCEALLNHWYTDYQTACDALLNTSSYFLLGYKAQYVVVEIHYLHALGFDEQDIADLRAAGRDLMGIYGTALWDRLAQKRVRSCVHWG